MLYESTISESGGVSNRMVHSLFKKNNNSTFLNRLCMVFTKKNILVIIAVVFFVALTFSQKPRESIHF